MAEGIGFIGSSILENYHSLLSLLPSFAQNFIQLFLLILVIVIYAIFIWKFHKFIATKNILELNLKQYIRAKHPVLISFFAAALYFVEYIIILPFLAFFWFAIFALFLIVLTEGLDVPTILLVSASIVAAVRMISYYSEDLSKDLAKLLPLTLLAIAVTKAGFFDFDRIIVNFSEIFNYIGPMFTYLVFIAVIEITLRFFDFIFSLFDLQEEQ